MHFCVCGGKMCFFCDFGGKSVIAVLVEKCILAFI